MEPMGIVRTANVGVCDRFAKEAPKNGKVSSSKTGGMGGGADAGMGSTGGGSMGSSMGKSVFSQMSGGGMGGGMGSGGGSKGSGRGSSGKGGGGGTGGKSGGSMGGMGGMAGDGEQRVQAECGVGLSATATRVVGSTPPRKFISKRQRVLWVPGLALLAKTASLASCVHLGASEF